MDSTLERELTPVAKLLHSCTGLTRDVPWERLPAETRAAYLNLAFDVDLVYRQRRRARWTSFLRRDR